MSIVIELSSEEANWVRDAVAHERERLQDADSDHHDPAEIAAVLGSAEEKLNDAIWDWDGVGQLRIRELINSGLTPVQAVDYLMTGKWDVPQTAWAKERETSQQSVSTNVRRAKETLKNQDE